MVVDAIKWASLPEPDLLSNFSLSEGVFRDGGSVDPGLQTGGPIARQVMIVSSVRQVVDVL